MKKLKATVLELKPRSKRLPVTIDASARPAFQPSPEDLFLGAEICAAGQTEVRDGKPRMLLKAPSDVTIRSSRRPPQQPWRLVAWHECDEGIETPTLLREVKPSYTMQAMGARIQGTVQLEAIVLADGTVAEARVTRSLDPKNGLDRNAVATVSQWLFRPGTKSGQPVPVVVTIEISYSLK